MDLLKSSAEQTAAVCVQLRSASVGIIINGSNGGHFRLIQSKTI